MSEKKTSYDKIRKLDPKIIYLLLAVSIVLPLLYPIGLPIPISPPTRGLYDVIQALPNGTVVWYGVDVIGGNVGELLPGVIATARHIFSRGLRIVFVSFEGDGPLVYGKIVSELSLSTDKKYGEDYAYLGFIPGHETGIAALANSVKGTAKVDYYQKPVDSLPILNGISTAKDFSLVISAVSVSSIAESYVRQVQGQHGVKLALLPTAAIYQEKIVYFPRQVVGMLNSLKGGAEYEQLTHNVSTASSAMDAFTTAQILLIVMVFIINVAYFGNKLGGH